MRGVLEADHFRHLEVDVAVDEIVVEHAAGLEKVTVGVETTQRLAQRAADGRNLLQLRRRQVVKILVDGAGAGNSPAAVQFERLAYFARAQDAAPGRPVFNRTVGLRDSWGRG
jgi:hypothetical protein